MRVLMDLMPAVVKMRKRDEAGIVRQLKGVRAVVTTEPAKVLVYEAQGSKAVLSKVIGYEGFERMGTQGFKMNVDDEEWVAIRDGGCGCGSPLRRISLGADLKALENDG